MREREHGTVGARGTDALRLALSQISRNMFKVASSPQVMEGTAKMLVLAVGVRSTAGAISIVMKETHVAVAATAATAAPIAPAATVAQTTRTRTRLDPIRSDSMVNTVRDIMHVSLPLHCAVGQVGESALQQKLTRMAEKVRRPSERRLCVTNVCWTLHAHSLPPCGCCRSAKSRSSCQCSCLPSCTRASPSSFIGGTTASSDSRTVRCPRPLPLLRPHPALMATTNDGAGRRRAWRIRQQRDALGAPLRNPSRAVVQQAAQS